MVLRSWAERAWLLCSVRDLLGRIGHPDEIAIAVEWLCSHDAAFITGTDLLVDGGQVSGIRWAGTMGEDPTDATTQAG